MSKPRSQTRDAGGDHRAAAAGSPLLAAWARPSTTAASAAASTRGLLRGPGADLARGPARRAGRREPELAAVPDRTRGPTARATVQFARDLRNWGRYAKALRCVAPRAFNGVRTPCVGLGSLVVSFAQAYARAVAAGNTRLAQDQCGWFARTSAKLLRAVRVLRAVAAGGVPAEACGVCGGRVKLLRKWGPTLHFSAVLYLALRPLGLNREAPPPSAGRTAPSSTSAGAARA